MPPVRISPGGLHARSSPHGPQHIPLRLAAPDTGLSSPEHFLGGLSGPGVPAASRLAAFGCWKQKKKKPNQNPPKKGRKTKRREAKQRGDRPPGRPPQQLLHIPVCWRRGCIGITNWKTFLRGENRFEKKNREKKGLFRPRRSHAGGEGRGGGSGPRPPRPPGSPGHAVTPSH